MNAPAEYSGPTYYMTWHVDLFNIERVSDQDASWALSGHVQLVEASGVDPEHAGGITYLIGLGAPGNPPEELETLLGMSGTVCLACWINGSG